MTFMLRTLSSLLLLTFQLFYHGSSARSCYHLVTGPFGIIASTSSDHDYDGHYCKWNIKVDRGRKIILTFNWNYILCSEGCIEVYDGETTSQLGEFCGSDIPDPVESTGNSMTVQFIISNKCFLAVYNTTGPETMALSVTEARKALKKTLIVVLGALLALALLIILGLLGYIAFSRHEKSEDSMVLLKRNNARTSSSTETNAARSSHLEKADEMEIEDNVNYGSFEASTGQQGNKVYVPSKVGPITGDIYSAVHKVDEGKFHVDN